MNFLLAPDSFKGCLSSCEVCKAMEKGILSEMPEAKVRSIPMADGGEGTTEALVQATGGKIIPVYVHDPLMRPVQSFIGISGDGNTAFLEMAAASGIGLLKGEERDPWKTTTYGTGELIKAAIAKGCKKIILGIGGSATNDGGVGMARALGAHFTDTGNREVKEGGGELNKITKIDISGLDTKLNDCRIVVACDVNNPFTGSLGASFVYASQKGADTRMIRQLDDNMKHLARLIKEQLGKDIDSIPGAGAAGGLGGGLMAFLGAELKPGFEIIRENTGLDQHIQWADVVITGEGKIDSQTQYGKTPMGIVRATKQFNKPVFAIAGSLGGGYSELYTMGFDAIVSVIDKPMTLDEAISTAPSLIEQSIRTIIRIYITGSRKA